MTQPALSNDCPPSRGLPDGLILRRPTLADAAGITALQSLPGFRFGTLRLPHPKQEDVETFLRNLPSEGGSLIGVLDGTVVASAGFNRFAARRNHAAHFGMGVHDDYTGRGIGRAIMEELLSIADNWMNLRRIELTVYTDNGPAIRLYESSGFQIEGTLRDFAFRNGAYVDAYSMARIRN